MPIGAAKTSRTTSRIRSQLAEVLPEGVIAMFSGDNIPDGWVLCDGSGNTTDMRDRYVHFTSSDSAVGNKFGSDYQHGPTHSHDGSPSGCLDNFNESTSGTSMACGSGFIDEREAQVEMAPRTVLTNFVKSVESSASVEGIESFHVHNSNDHSSELSLLDGSDGNPDWTGRMPRCTSNSVSNAGDTFGSDTMTDTHSHSYQDARSLRTGIDKVMPDHPRSNLDSTEIEVDILPEVVLLHAVRMSDEDVDTGQLFLWDGAVSEIPENFSLADGSGGTEDVIGRAARVASGDGELLDRIGSGQQSLGSHTHGKSLDSTSAGDDGDSNVAEEVSSISTEDAGTVDIEPKQIDILPIQVVS